MKYRFSRVVLTAAITAAGLQHAYGQQSDTTAELTQTSQLDQVVVTARKTGERIIDVPVAVTAINAQELEDRGVSDIRDLQAYVPGFADVGGASFGRFDRGATYFVIRGMIPGRTISPLRQNVSVFVDGVPVSGGNIAGLSDVDRVEVVKGPQSAYFGRSTFGGAINLVTREPGFEWRGKLTSDYSTYGTNETMGSVEGPIIPDVVSFRASARYYHTDGQYPNEQGGRLGEQQTSSATAQLLIKPMDSLKISLFGTFWQDNDGPPADGVIGGPWAKRNAYNCDMGLGNGNNNGVCGVLPGLPYVSLWQDAAALGQPAIHDTLTNATGLQHILPAGSLDHLGLFRKAYETHATADYALPGGYSLNANFGLNRDAFAPMADGIQIQLADPDSLRYIDRDDTLNHDFSAEVRLTSPRDYWFKWMVGSNYLNQYSRTATPCWFFGPLDCTVPQKDSASTKGLFASASADVAGFSLTGEVRYQWDKISSDVLDTASASHTFKSATPRAILSRNITHDSNVYFSYSRGTKPGTFNLNLLTLTAAQQAQVINQTNAELAVPEEHIDMYELGLKGDFFDHRLRILSDIYYGRWTNQQITKTGLYSLVTSGNATEQSIGLTVPVGQTDLQGIELETEYKITQDLLFSLQYNLADSNIRDYSCGTCATFETGNDNVTGHRLPLFARDKATASLTYSHALSSEYDGFIRGEYTYRSRIFADETNLTWIGAATNLNMRLGVQGKGYLVEVYGRNLLDNKAYQSVAWGGTFLGSLATNDINEWVVGPAERLTGGVRASLQIGSVH